MATDPKKNDEIKDAELDKVSGGAETEQPNEQPEGDGPVIIVEPRFPVQSREKT